MPQVAVVGSLNMDLVVRMPRYPRAGETISGSEFQTIPGGKGANQAVAAARQGSDVVMIGRVGDDLFGQRLSDKLHQDGIITKNVFVTQNTPSGVAFIVVDDDGENFIIIVPGANGKLKPSDVDMAKDNLIASQVVILQLEVPMSVVEHTAKIAHENASAVVLNPAPAQPLSEELLKNVDYLIPNETEVTSLANDDQLSIEEAANKLRAKGVANVIVTLGEKGALIVNDAGTMHIPGFSVSPVDTTAAGDAFIGTFAAKLAEGADVVDAVRYANAAGALATLTLGAQPSLPTRVAVDDFLATNNISSG